MSGRMGTRRAGVTPRRPLLAALLVAAMSTPAMSQSVSQAQWAGWAQCVVSTQSPGYDNQATHTWITTGGAPTAQGAFQMHPATWSASGWGSMQRQGSQSPDAQWTMNVSAVSAPIAVVVRASDGRRLIRAGHAQLRQSGAIAGTRTLSAAGPSPAISAISADAFEWTFPTIEDAGTSARIQGTATGDVGGSFGYMQPAASRTTASCRWDFAQGAVAPSPVPTVAAPPSIVAASGAVAGMTSSSAAATAAGSGGGNSMATLAGTAGSGAARQAARAGAGVAVGGSGPGSNGAAVVGASGAGMGTIANAPSGGTRPRAAGAVGRPSALPPGNVAVNGTPLIARLTWSAAPNATRYAVWRREPGTSALERTPPGFTALAFDDTTADPRITYSYVVTSYDSNGASADAPAVSFVSPAMTNPAGFKATYMGSFAVNLTWQPVAGAQRYRVDGPGLPNTGAEGTAIFKTVTGVPPGALSFKVTAIFPGNFADFATASVATLMVRELPPRGAPFLSKSNGAGSPAMATAHYSQLCPGAGADCLKTLENLARSGGYEARVSDPFWGDPLSRRLNEEAVYGNVADLGFGRRTKCSQVMSKGPEGLVTICYSTSHGPGPGAPGFADSATITRAAAGEAAAAPYTGAKWYWGITPTSMHKNPWGEMPRSGTVIIKVAQGTSFYAFTVGKWDLLPRESSLTWNSWEQMPALQTVAEFDSEGSKAVPHSCIACHGGRWNAATKRVDGATLLPIDPGTLVFGKTMPGDRTTYERSGQEENIRRINQIVAQSAPGTAVASYISGLYGGAVGSTGTVARANYVPQGWATQSGFYQSVVKPYCASCHLAAPSSVNLSSWANFYQNRALIYNAVCVAKTMPHSEIAFRSFWTKDTGPVFVPGLLAATLGYSSCP